MCVNAIYSNNQKIPKTTHIYTPKKKMYSFISKKIQNQSQS